MSKVNSKRAKMVVAKVKNVNSKPKAKETTKASLPKAEPKAINSTIQAMVYPNKGKYEIDHVKVNLKGSDKSFTALAKVNIDINELNIHELIKKLFNGLTMHDKGKFMFGYKNVYGFAFGIVPKGFNSYKSVITHHKGDGIRSLIINSNKQFGMGEIEKVLTKLSLSFENHKTYIKAYVSKENIDKFVKACQGLVGVSQIG